MDNGTLLELKAKIIRTAAISGEGHIPSALSILDLVWIIYDKLLHKNDNAAKKTVNDKFVLSKGHGCLALYAVLERKGLLPKGTLDTFCQFDSVLGGHPDSNKVKPILASAGSLGHGFPFALGLAMGAKIKTTKADVYCIVGDGECNEGVIWETALVASTHNLENLVCIVDNNGSSMRAVNLGSIEKKFEAFGWEVTTIDGHSHRQIETTLTSKRKIGKPFAVIANTIKGNGIRSMESNPAWHHKSPSKDELAQLLRELDS